MRKRPKYNNRKIERADGKFDSKREYTVWLKLKRQEEMGLIENLQRQVPFVLIPKSKFGREIKYVADYVYNYSNSEQIVVLDLKSEITEKNPVFKLKARLFAEKYGFEITILK